MLEHPFKNALIPIYHYLSLVFLAVVLIFYVHQSRNKNLIDDWFDFLDLYDGLLFCTRKKNQGIVEEREVKKSGLRERSP